MASPSDLTTLAAVKTWMGTPDSGSDAQIGALISPASRAIMSHLGRPSLLPRAWSDRYDARPGLRRVVLRNWPIIAVSEVMIGNRVLNSVNPGAPSLGYALETDPWGGAPPGIPLAVDLLDGAAGCGGRQAILVNYTAGYQETDSVLVPSGGGAVTPAPLYGNWASDQGVAYALTGAALTLVASTPAEGQYSVSAGVYTFAAADASAALLVSYGYVPFDIAQACIELVAQRSTAGSRVGVKTKSLGGMESVSYDTTAIPDAVKGMLRPYRQAMQL